MLWDPKRFPMMTYQLNKDDYPSLFRLGKTDKEFFKIFFNWRFRIMLNLLIPKRLSKVKDMEKVLSRRSKALMPERVGIMEYLEDASKTDEHHVRVYESFDCCGFENVGTMMASYLPPYIAGMCKALESWKGVKRDWNAVETKYIGHGDPYCEFKLVPGEIKELRNSLEKDSSVIERIHEQLISCLMGFLIDGKPLVERTRLGSDVHFHPVFHTMVFPAIAGERFRMVLRMGGSKSGRDVGERLLNAGIVEDEAVKRVFNLLEYCKVGKPSMNETIRIRENCESFWSKFWSTPDVMEPSCFFTTGFLNGFFSAIIDQHVKETKCIVKGDPYCEWEFK
jgi:predicted hydrocarbon binding protein